jgi:hypothetical protein
MLIRPNSSKLKAFILDFQIASKLRSGIIQIGTFKSPAQVSLPNSPLSTHPTLEVLIPQAFFPIRFTKQQTSKPPIPDKSKFTTALLFLTSTLALTTASASQSELLARGEGWCLGKNGCNGLPSGNNDGQGARPELHRPAMHHFWTGDR